MIGLILEEPVVHRVIQVVRETNLENFIPLNEPHLDLGSVAKKTLTDPGPFLGPLIIPMPKEI